jgi:hypothetical protein
MTTYAVVIPRTGRDTHLTHDLARAKAVAVEAMSRLHHPKYPPEVIVQRIGPDGRRRKVWTANLPVSA